MEWLRDTGVWDVLGRISDEEDAIARLDEAAANPDYDLFGHKCEHFARYVAMGRRESIQLQGAGTVVGLAALVYFSSPSKNR